MKAGQKLVCIDGSGPWIYPDAALVEGEIYTFDRPSKQNPEYLFLREFLERRSDGYFVGFDSRILRPVDDTFGPAICEIIEKQVEVEEMEKISV